MPSFATSSSSDFDGRAPPPQPLPPQPLPLALVEDGLLREAWQRRDVMDGCFSAFMCPIAHEVMKEPVVLADGNTYDREAIDRWLQQNDTSPLTGMTLSHKRWVPNNLLRGMISHLNDAAKKLQKPPLMGYQYQSTLAEFNGADCGASYLVFQKGDLVVRVPHALAADGWSFGFHVDCDKSRIGWFPEAFLDAGVRGPGSLHQTEYSFDGSTYGPDYLVFRRGDVIEWLGRDNECGGWAYGVHFGRGGWFPEAYCGATTRRRRTWKECCCTLAAFHGADFGGSYLTFGTGETLMRIPHAESGGGWVFGVVFEPDVFTKGWFPAACLDQSFLDSSSRRGESMHLTVHAFDWSEHGPEYLVIQAGDVIWQRHSDEVFEGWVYGGNLGRGGWFPEGFVYETSIASHQEVLPWLSRPCLE